MSLSQSTERPVTVDLTAVLSSVRDPMRDVNRTLQQALHSDVTLIAQMGQYIINGGGKRIRPHLVLLSAQACGYQGQDHIQLAAIVELIHTATLLHDDVVDASSLRRGQATANERWGNEAAVLVGDFLYSRSFEMMVGIGRMDVMQVLAETTNTIAKGEVLQLLNCHDADVDEARYLEVIRNKTAKLFEAATLLGALISNQNKATCTALAEYGMQLGMAFQLVDDVLDYIASPDQAGKNMGDDLAEGNPTLPLIHAMQNGNEQQRQLIRDAIIAGRRADIDAVMTVVKATGGIDRTLACARELANHACTALQHLPSTPAIGTLHDLARFAVQRDR